MQRASADEPADEPKRARKAPPTPLNAARTAAEAAAAASEAEAKAAALAALQVGVQTRRTAIGAEQRMRDDRARIERELDGFRSLRREKEADLLELLSNPLQAWDQDAFWQLAMCEFVLDIDDEDAAALKPRERGRGC